MMNAAQFRVSLDSGGGGIVSMSCPRCGKIAVKRFDRMTSETKVACRCGTSFGIGSTGYQTAKLKIEHYHKVIDAVANGLTQK